MPVISHMPSMGTASAGISGGWLRTQIMETFTPSITASQRSFPSASMTTSIGPLALLMVQPPFAKVAMEPSKALPVPLRTTVLSSWKDMKPSRPWLWASKVMPRRLICSIVQ